MSDQDDVRQLALRFAANEIDERQFLDRMKELTARTSHQSDPDRDSRTSAVDLRQVATGGLRGAAVANRIRRL
jgi:hypothetical protein